MTSKPVSLTVTNNTSGPIGLLGSSNISDFAFQENECNMTLLPAGASCHFLVTFTPSAVGAVQGSVTVGTASDPFTLQVSGSGVPAGLTASPATLDFGKIGVGTTSNSATVTMYNYSASPVSLIGTSNLGKFKIEPTTCGPLLNSKATLGVGGSCAFAVSFDPSALGAQTGTVTLGTPSQPLTYSISGTGVAAGIVFSPANSSFGNVKVGATSSPIDITISNYTGSAIGVLASTNLDKFTITQDACGPLMGGGLLDVGASCTFTATFSPKSAGAVAATATIGTGSSSKVYSLTGTGVAPPTGQLTFVPAMVNFGSVTVGSTSQQLTVTATNTTNAPVKYDGYSNAANFGFQPVTCGPVDSGTMLGANASCTFKVTFSPTAPGTDVGNFGVKTASGAVVFTLAGLAVPGECLSGQNCISGQVAQPVATPEVVPLSTPTTVSVTAAVNGNNLVKGSVNLVRFDQYGALVGPAGQMFDDGTHGDATAGDGIYTAQVQISEANKQEIYFRVAAVYTGDSVTLGTLSYTVEVVATSPLMAADFKLYNTTMAAASSKYRLLIQNGSSLYDAQAKVVDWLNEQVGIDVAGAAASSGVDIWVVFSSGLLGGLAISDDNDVRGAGGVSTNATQMGTRTAQHSYAASATTNLPKTATVSRFAPFSSDFPDETAPISMMLAQGSSTACPLPTKSSYLDDQAGLDSFMNLDKNDIVLISGHGDAWYGHLSTHSHFYPHSWSEPQPIIATATTFDSTTTFSPEVQMEMELGRVLMVYREPLHSTDVLAITPAFIRAHYHPSPSRQNIIYAGTCDSLLTDDLAQAFLDNGANTFYGYSAIVSAPFAYQASQDLFMQLEGGLSTSAAQLGLSSFTNIDRNQDDRDNVAFSYGGYSVVWHGNKTPGGSYTSLVSRQKADTSLPACPPAQQTAVFIFDDGEPGNMSVAINHVVQNFNGLQQGQSESLGFTELPEGQTYTLGVAANGGFADYTINLPSGFVFPDGTSTVTSHVISFSGPNFYTFTNVGTSTPPVSSVRNVPATVASK